MPGRNIAPGYGVVSGKLLHFLQSNPGPHTADALGAVLGRDPVKVPGIVHRLNAYAYVRGDGQVVLEEGAYRLDPSVRPPLAGVPRRRRAPASPGVLL